MRCPKVRRRLSAYQDGELKPGEAVRVEAHLQDCPACRERYQELDRIWRSLGELGGIQPSPGFYSRLARRIEGQQRAGLLTRLRWAVHPLTAALPSPAVLILGILVGIYTGNLVATGGLKPLRSRSGSSMAGAVTLLSLRAFDAVPPGTLGEGYLRAVCELKDGHR
jgi:predicted anti-sigma-YlaC factor YlaD